MTDLVVLGRGPAGLAAAITAAERGMDVVVMGPATEEVTIEVDGVAIPLGTAWLPPADPHATGPTADVEALLQRIEPGGMAVGDLTRIVHVAGCWTEAPAQTTALLRHHRLSLSGRRLLERGPQHVIAQHVIAPHGRPRQAPGPTTSPTYADIARDAVGPSLAAVLHLPMAQRVFGRPADQLAGAAAAHRPHMPGSWTQRAPSRSVRWPAGGIAGLTAALESLAHGAGVTIGDQDLVSLDPGPPATLTTVGGAWRPRAVLSTLPLDDLARTADAPELVVARAALRRRGMIHLLVEVDAGLDQADAVHELPTGPSPVVRLQSRPSATGHVIHAEVPADPGSPVWQLSAQALVEELLEALDRTGLGRPSVRRASVHRVEGALDALPRGWEVAVAGVRRWAARAGVAVVAPRRLFAQPHLDVDVRVAIAAVAAIGQDGTVDADRWRAAVRDADAELLLPTAIRTRWRTSSTTGQRDPMIRW